MASPQLELFRCATAPPVQALQLWHELLDRIPVEDFDYPAQRLLPAVWTNLKKAAKDFPEEARLRGVYRLSWIKNSTLQRDCLETLELFQASTLPVIVLKGQVLNTLLYQDQGARSANDFDLLVPFQSASEALELLAGQGWEPACGAWPQPETRLENAVALRRGRSELDLHWYLLREARRQSFDQTLWERAVPFTLAGRRALTLCPSHQLFHLLVSAGREPENMGRYLIDILLLVRRYGGEVDQTEVLQMLRERRLSSRLSRLPLGECGLEEVGLSNSPPLMDKVWSEATRYVGDGSHEWHYLLFPFLDFWFHYRGGQEPQWAFLTYMARRLEVDGAQDFLLRSFRKLLRMAKQSWA